MKRRDFLRTYKVMMLGLGLAALASVGLRVEHADATPMVPSLRDQLEKGLKARLPEEFVFIDVVVTMVDAGTLPRELVDKVFFYVRREKSHKKYLVPYFERLLRAKAREQGIEIPLTTA